jgi:DUF4097 and DUF4098 domain-containing protein YvlB
MKRFALLMAASSLVLALGACNQVEPEKEIRTESFTLPTSYRLEINTFNGSIHVSEGEGPQVIVVATISQPKQLTYDARVEGDTLKITAEVTEAHTTPSPGVTLNITAPPNAGLDLRSSNGRIAVEGVGTGGDIETSNGSISLERVEGLYVVNTSNGRVVLSDVSGSFGVHTSNGSIQFDGRLDPDTNTLLRTSNGGITFIVGEDADVEIDAETNSGDIEVAYPLDNATVSAEKVFGTLGTGSTKVRLRTANGDINIR